ncbi:MAG: hypothetical protein RL162_918 [Pseudomonadota bacterium]
METLVDFSSYLWLLLLFTAFASGLVDAIAGGGGLIQVPALFMAYPDAHPATLLSANKVSSIGGTINAARRYLKHAQLPWNILGPAIIGGFIGALLGAFAVSVFPSEPLRKALPFMLVFLLAYTWFAPSFGLENRPPQKVGRHEEIKAIAMGLVIGFYDGFFGPATGSFFLFAFVRLFYFDFLHASAATKLVNVTTNFAAVFMLVSLGFIDWPLGLIMMVANIIGSQIGSKLAIKHGSQFVRKIFLVVVMTLIAKSGYTAFFSN